MIDWDNLEGEFRKLDNELDVKATKRLGSYRKMLIEEGFSESQAFELVSQLHQSCLKTEEEEARFEAARREAEAWAVANGSFDDDDEVDDDEDYE